MNVELLTTDMTRTTLNDKINELQTIVIDVSQQREELSKRYDTAYSKMMFYLSLRSAIEEAGGDSGAFNNIESSTIGELADALSSNNIRFIHQK